MDYLLLFNYKLQEDDFRMEHAGHQSLSIVFLSMCICLLARVMHQTSLNQQILRKGMQCERSGCIRMMFEKGVLGVIDVGVDTGNLARRNRKDLVHIHINVVILVCVIETLHACRRPAAAPCAWSSLAGKNFGDLTRASPTKGTLHWSKHGEEENEYSAQVKVIWSHAVLYLVLSFCRSKCSCLGLYDLLRI
jgi:hypothetical protein